MINSAKQNEVVSIPTGVHIISKPIIIKEKIWISEEAVLEQKVIY